MAQPVLDYAPKQRRRFPWKPVIACSILVAVSVSGYFLLSWLGHVIWDYRMRRAHDACAVCVLDATHPTFIFDGKSIALAKGLPVTDGEKNVQALGLTTGCDLIFSHERQTRSGISRIVILQANRLGSIYGETFFNCRVLGPSVPGNGQGWVRFADIPVKRLADGLAIGPLSGHPLTIYYGQADPVDKSHFWFDYEMDGKRGTIDGYLEDIPAGYEWVRLEERMPKP